jgi:hypothetical protein
MFAGCWGMKGPKRIVERVDWDTKWCGQEVNLSCEWKHCEGEEQERRDLLGIDVEWKEILGGVCDLI